MVNGLLIFKTLPVSMYTRTVNTPDVRAVRKKAVKIMIGFYRTPLNNSIDWIV